MSTNDLLTDLRAKRAHATARMTQILDQSEQRDGKMLASEKREFDKINGQVAILDTQIEKFQSDVDAREEGNRRKAELGMFDAVPRSPDGMDGGRGHTYYRGGPHSYLRDLAYAAIGSHPRAPEANERLQRHGHEMEIDARANPNGIACRMLGGPAALEERAGLTTVTGAGGTFVPPIYLVADYVPLQRPHRPFADAITTQQLPHGTDSINIPKINTGTAVASQATQNTAVLETDLTDAYLTSPVVTIAGQQTVSLQLLEQSPISFDEVVLEDMVRALHAELDRQCINGSGASGQLQGLLNIPSFVTVAYTDASPTVPKLWSKLSLAIETVHANRFAPPTAIFMTPLRWAWFLAALDSTNNRPLVVPIEQGPYNALAVNTDPVSEGRVGSVGGIPVYVDPAIPSNLGAGTNQDPVIVLRTPDIFLWEGGVTTRALPQTLGNQLSILFQTYQYAAYLANRYVSASAAVNGTGTIAPAL
jgi:HK97 family phage major capsid protein